MKVILPVLTFVLLFSNCVFNPVERDFDEEFQRISVDLGFEIEQAADLGLYVDRIHVLPWGFTLLESPEDIEELESVTYSGFGEPTLEELFPENGMLLIYSSSYPWAFSVAEHKVSHSSTVLSIDELRHVWKDLHDPGVSDILYAIQVIPR